MFTFHIYRLVFGSLLAAIRLAGWWVAFVCLPVVLPVCSRPKGDNKTIFTELYTHVGNVPTRNWLVFGKGRSKDNLDICQTSKIRHYEMGHFANCIRFQRQMGLLLGALYRRLIGNWQNFGWPLWSILVIIFVHRFFGLSFYSFRSLYHDIVW